MLRKIVSLVLVFLTLFNFVGYVKVQAFSVSTSVGLLVFGTLLVASGIYVSSKTDVQFLYDIYLDTLDSFDDYITWSKVKFGAALATGEWIFDKSEEYVSSFLNNIVGSYEEAKEKYGYLRLSDEVVYSDVDVIDLTGYSFYHFSDDIDCSDYGGYLGTRDLSVDVMVNDRLYNIYFDCKKSGRKYYYDMYLNGVLVENFPSYWLFSGMDSSYYVGLLIDSPNGLRCFVHSDSLEFSGRIGFGDGYQGQVHFSVTNLSSYPSYATSDVVHDVCVNLDNTDNVIDNPDMVLGLNNPTMPLINVDEFGAYYDDAIGQYVFEGDIDTLVDALENTGQLDNVLDRTLGLRREGVDTLPNVRVNEGEGVVTWDKVGELDTSIPDVSNPDIPSVWERLFVPSEVDLDFSPLMGISISDKFPFCIPFDFYKSIKIFSSDVKQPSFVIDLNTSFFEVYHEIDLSPFIFYISFFRYVVVIWFSYILMSKTRDFIKW